MSPATSSASLLADWATWMRAGSMSPRTVTDRVQLVQRLERATGENSLTIRWEPLADFLGNPGFQPGTRQTYHAHLRCWFGWLLLMDHRIDDPTAKLKSPPSPRRVPHPVSIEQLSTTLDTRMHRRTRVMVLLGAYEGFRESEIAAVRGEDLDGERLWVTGKGEVRDYVPVHDMIAAAAESMPTSGWWFPSHTRPGEHITGNSVSTMLSQLLHRAGVPLTAHALRHFFGTETLRATGNLALTQKLMRHASITSTVIYTLVEDAERKAAVAALPLPRGSSRAA